MADTMQQNQSEITKFILLGFGELHDMQILLSLFFLSIYILTMTANILTVLLIVIDHRLHTPMYFFLGNLSCLETFYCSTTLPKMLASLLTGEKTISFIGCITQLYFVGFLGSTECYLLSAMSYDRFLAICKPLHYTTLMNGKLCVQLAAGSWINGMILTLVYLVLVLQLQYCGPNEIDHFFCESLSLVQISCSYASLVKYASVILAIVFTFPPFLLTLISYVYIIAAILRIPSTTGRQKAFSTCSSHLIVVSIFYGAIIIVYMTPKIEIVIDLNKIFSLLYTVLPPLVNPLIYSLRNKDVKESLRKAAGKLLGSNL
ncbi:olfactory receptor 10A7-like [Hemicordylus capensis]|uniref:olfactory receptor 10A7-like n=1 Tax=Hemicordylus capensis TaxID=884348 RepID=UPI002302C086|nr:olfactory receptor 10A7-like [Hemicordylus capensis]